MGYMALFAIGPSVKPIVIKGLQDHNSAVRSACASTLGGLVFYCGTDIKDSVPALTACLQDADSNVRFNSALALGYLKADATRAVSRLIPLLKDPQNKVYVRATAARTLGKIGPQANTALPALRSVLKDKAPYDRSMAAIAAQAKEAVPALLGQLTVQGTPDSQKWFALEKITNALIKIDPVAAARAGVLPITEGL